MDTRRDLAESTNVLIGELGGTPLNEATIASMVGTGVNIWLKQALALAGIAPFPPHAIDRFNTIYDQRLLNHTRPYEGMSATVAQLAVVTKLAVLTNKLHHATVKILEGLELAKFFTQIAGAGGAYPLKPAPGGLKAIMEQAEAKPPETVLVGDSPVDLQTARNAEVRICLARFGFGFVDVSPFELRGDELFIDRPDELPSLLGYASGPPSEI